MILYDAWDFWLIDYPLDIIFALNQVAITPLEGLEGLLDANNAGVMGYSFDGYDALALSGARVDPDYYLDRCASASTINPAPPDWWFHYICDLSEKWAKFAEHAGEEITSSSDDLWQPMTDKRIKAVMPMAPEGAWLFGDRGLGYVDRPVLIISAAKDDINIYDLEAVFIYENMGTTDKKMISFIDKGHMMIYDDEPVAYMKHFATAFFGHHLKGIQEYEQYYSQDYLAQFSEFAWGVYR